MAQFCLNTAAYGFQNAQDNSEHMALSWHLSMKQLDIIQDTNIKGSDYSQLLRSDR